MARFNGHKVNQDNIGNVKLEALDVYEYAEIRVRKTLASAFDALDDEIKNGKGGTRLQAARTVFEMTGVLKSKIFDQKKESERTPEEAFLSLATRVAALPAAVRQKVFEHANEYDDEVISNVVPLHLPEAPK